MTNPLKPWLFTLDAERVHEEVSGLMGFAACIPGGRGHIVAIDRARAERALGKRFSA